MLSPPGHSRRYPETRPCHHCPPQHTRATTWGPWQPVPPSPLPTVRRTLKSGLSDDLVQALGLGRAPGMEV